MRDIGRRDFMKASAAAVAAAALPRASFGNIDGDGRVKIAIVGAGRMGRRAAKALMTVDDDISIVAVADAFSDCAFPMRDELAAFARARHSKNDKLFDVPDSRVFCGLDCYKSALSCGADIAVLATPPVFRPREVECALDADMHIFLEKPDCVDPVQARKMFELAKIAKIKKRTVLSGTQRRYHAGYREAVERVKDGQIGEIISAQCLWFLAHFDGMDLKTPPNADPEELEYQLRNWALFTWASGDHIVEQQVHNLDIMNWVFGRNPKIVNGLGGRGTDLPMPQYGNRFSHFAVDYDYGDDVRMTAMCRQEPGTSPLILERVVGTKGVMETSLFTRQSIRGETNWTAAPARDPTLVEHETLLKSVREGLAINTLEEMTNSSMLSIAGRISAYSGMRFKYDWALMKSQESLMPKNLEFGKLPIAPLAVPGKYRLS